jgi:predicted DCC family thiol-disulfide oxidoreductase YuxK
LYRKRKVISAIRDCAALEAHGVDTSTTEAVLAVNAGARLAALRAALFVVALVAAIALFFTRWIPTRPPGAPALVP